MSSTLKVPAREIDIKHDVDVCVVGGGCTGVFAAVNAARSGASVVLLESKAMLGGMATTAMVGFWNRLDNIEKDTQIIGGLTRSVIDNLVGRNGAREIEGDDRNQFNFNPAELSVELDKLIKQHDITVMLCTQLSDVVINGTGVIDAILYENNEGCKAIKANQFIDATGDCELVHRSGFETVKSEQLQPVSYQSIISGFSEVSEEHDCFWASIREDVIKRGVPDSIPWMNTVPGSDGAVHLMFGPRQKNIDATNNEDLTKGLMDGRFINSTILDVIREKSPQNGDKLCLLSNSSALGVRETRRAVCLHELKVEELLEGVRFDDAIANGTYPVDIHHKGGTLLRFLNGDEEIITPDEHKWGRWKEEGEKCASFYQIPYRSLIPKESKNLHVCGRGIGADRDAFSAIRVMVTCNQTGEAAGVGAAIASQNSCEPKDISSSLIREKLSELGSIII